MDTDLDKGIFDYAVMRVAPGEIENNWPCSYLVDEIKRCLKTPDIILAAKVYQTWKGMFKGLYAHKDEFRFLGRFPVDDGCEWRIYERSVTEQCQEF